jgi:hypothetical protein
MSSRRRSERSCALSAKRNVLRLDRNDALAAARTNGFARPGDRLRGFVRRLLTPDETRQVLDLVALYGHSPPIAPHGLTSAASRRRAD